MTVNKNWGSTHRTSHPSDKSIPPSEVHRPFIGTEARAVAEKMHKRKRRRRDKACCQDALRNEYDEK